MVISTARDVISSTRDNCIISRDDFILHCEIKHRRTEYESSLDICYQILYELDQIIMALYRLFDVIKQL